MRAVICFGDFRIWDFELTPGREFMPIYIIHPLDQLSIKELQNPDFTARPLKRMCFEYVKRLDADLLEYRFVGES